MAKRTPRKPPARKKSSTRNTGSARPHPPTPEIEIIVRGLWLHGHHVLLCRNLKHGYLFLPGGHVEFGEPAAAALAREFLEETGVTIRVGPLALITEGAFTTRKRPHHELNLVFHVKHVGGRGLPKVMSAENHIGFEWVDLAAMVDMDIRPTAIKAWLAAGPAGHGVEWVSEVP